LVLGYLLVLVDWGWFMGFLVKIGGLDNEWQVKEVCVSEDL